MKNLLVIVACIWLLAGCAVKKTNTPISPTSLEGEWILQTLQGVNITNLQRPITIHFIEAENRVNGYAGCNQYFSSYTKTGFSIQFHGTGSTKMYCEGTMNIEEKFTKALAEVNIIKSEGSKLLLLKGESLLLEFIR